MQNKALRLIISDSQSRMDLFGKFFSIEEGFYARQRKVSDFIDGKSGPLHLLLKTNRNKK